MMKSKRNKDNKQKKRNKRSIKNKKRDEDFKKTNCSPNPDKKKYSCYSDKSLHRMKQLWNIRHPMNKIKSNDSKVIWNSLKENMSNSCNKESCWLRSNFMKGNLDNELLNYFNI